MTTTSNKTEIARVELVNGVLVATYLGKRNSANDMVTFALEIGDECEAISATHATALLLMSGNRTNLAMGLSSDPYAGSDEEIKP